MGTKLYLRDYSVDNGPLPHYRTYSGDVAHAWPDITNSFGMSTISGDSETYAGGNFLVNPIPHDSHVRTFVSGRLKTHMFFGWTQVFSFAAKMGQSHYKVVTDRNFNPDDGTSYFTYETYSTEINPVVFLYAWNENTGFRTTLSDVITLSNFDPDVIKNYTYSNIPLNSVWSSAGDRIVCEIHYKQTSQNGWIGFATEQLYFDTSDSYISFSGVDFSTSNIINKSDKYIYHMRNRTALKSRRFPYANYAYYRTSSARRFPYKLLENIYSISNSFESIYDFYSYRYITLYAETESTARGRVSMNITPRASVSFNTYFDDYLQKWAFPEPTLHKFIMIDDFEGYDALSDMALNWTISDGLVTFSAIKTFSAINMEDYDVMTIYANGNFPTTLQAWFGDKYGNSSSIVPFLITDRWERYEQSVSWGDCNPKVVTSVRFESDQNSSITLDDIFMLNHNPVTENTDWMKMNLTDIELSRGQKMATFKIPFKQQEMIQFSGENNGEGELRIRSIDTMQTSFLDECLKTNTPLYFRYKNMGLPIVLRNSNRSFKQIIPTQVSSEVSLPFYEIYDYSKF